MKHAVIIGHPAKTSLTLSLATAYIDQARMLGDEVLVRDLYREEFDPRLQAAEIPRPEGFCAEEDVKSERRLLADVDIFAFFYPLWFNAPPAIVVGYIQRVFGMGFGYGRVRGGGNQPLLNKRRMISFSTSGAPKDWLEQEGGWNALRNTFDQHLANVCGMEVVNHVHFGDVTGGMREDVADRYIAEVKLNAENVCGISRV